MLVTAASHCPADCAPFEAGLYCLVSLPIPAALSTCPHRTLHERHVQIKFSGEPFDSLPSTWPISIRTLLPQKAQSRRRRWRVALCPVAQCTVGDGFLTARRPR
jgi:hypothetical protein